MYGSPSRVAASWSVATRDRESVERAHLVVDPHSEALRHQSLAQLLHRVDVLVCIRDHHIVRQRSRAQARLGNGGSGGVVGVRLRSGGSVGLFRPARLVLRILCHAAARAAHVLRALIFGCGAPQRYVRPRELGQRNGF